MKLCRYIGKFLVIVLDTLEQAGTTKTLSHLATLYPSAFNTWVAPSGDMDTPELIDDIIFAD